MVHVFLLVSLFSSFDVSGLGSQSVTGLENDNSLLLSLNEVKDASIEVSFSKNPILNVGDPVLYNGNVVGSISKIEQDGSKEGLTNVSLRLEKDEVPVDQSLVALAGSVKVGKVSKGRKRAKQRYSSRNFVELLSFRSNIASSKNNSGSSVVKGYSSFQEFWATRSAI